MLEHALLDALIEAKKLKNDRQLALYMGLTAPHLSIMRSSEKTVTDQFRIAVQRKFGWSLKRIDALAPPKEGRSS